MSETENNKQEDQNNNPPCSPNLFQEIISLRDQKIYLITKSLEDKISEILSYIYEDCTKNPISNKIQLLKYLGELFNNIEYNSEIFSCKISNEKKLNIFEVIIHEYVLNTKGLLNNPNEEQIKEIENYKEELKNIFSILLSSITLDKKVYHYILSFLINYINQKNNNIEANQKINSEQISRILELLHIYYKSVQNIDNSYNYLYFNNLIKEENKSNYLITVTNKENLNKKKILTLDDSLNILLFVKLISNEEIKKVEPEHISGLLEIVFSDSSKNISFDIDNENNLINKNTKDKITKLKENQFIDILIRINLKESLKLEIYQNNKKIDFKNDQITINDNEKAKIKEKYEIKSINFFKNFIGECSNIILFKNKKVEGLPKFFLHLQNIEEKKPKANTISALFDQSTKNKNEKTNLKQELVLNPIFEKGFNKEDLFNILLKQELKDDVDQNIIEKIIPSKSPDKIAINDIKEFLDKLLAIYIPSRFEIPNELGVENVQNSQKIILKDSINHLDAIFNKINSFENEDEKSKFSNLNGVHIFNHIVDDLNNIGGLNHLIPIIELMTNYPEELLTTDNICSFFSLITLILNPYYKNALKDEEFSNFFFNLSYFLEKISDSFYNNELAGSFINLSQLLMSFMSQDTFVELNRQYQKYILFNQKFLFKFKQPEQKNILEQIKSVITTSFTNNNYEDLNIEMSKIINLLLYYDKEKYNKFCCKNHSEYFNTKSDIMNPELNEVIKPLEEIIKLFFKKYNNHATLIMRENKDNKNQNIEVPKSGIDLINLFEVLTLATSPCIQKSIIALFLEFFNENVNQSYKYVHLIEKDGKFFDICLFVFKSSIFEIKIDILNFIYLLLRMKNNLNKNASTSKTKDKDKEILSSINLSGLKEIFMINNILPFYLLPKEELKDVQNEKIKKHFYISGIKYNYLNKTETENKLYSNYNQAKIHPMIFELFTNIYKAFIEAPSFTINLKLLIKILSKSDISLIITFLQNLNNLSKDKNKSKEIFDSQELLLWILETSFQSFMIKSTNYNKNKFLSRFYFRTIEEKEIKPKIDLLNQLCNELLINIFKKNIYKLDYLLTWAKYYNEISKNNNIITNELFLEFIFNLLMEFDKQTIKKDIIICDKNDITNFNLIKEGLYFINILFELITYFKYTPIKKGNDENFQLNEDKNIYDDLFSSFNTLLINEPKNNKISQSLKEKWKYYTYLKKLFQYFSPIWNKINKEENDLFGKYMDNKKNINAYIEETEILFYTFDDLNENADSSKKNIINKGIQVIYILYHFFTNLFNYGGDKEDIKEILTEFRQFLTFVIVASCTLSTNIDKKKRKWPKSEDYQLVQLTIKNVLYYSIHFFFTKIKIFDEILESKNLSETEKDYYLYTKNALYETFGFLLKSLNKIYRVIRKEEDKKNSKKGMKGLFSKMKGIFTDSEGIKTSGAFLIMEKLYTNIHLNTNFDIKNYLDNIPNIEFKSKDIKNITVNSNLETCIKSFITETKLKSFFEAISSPSKEEEELNKNKLYPFVDYIKKRTQLLSSFIPCYDNLQNVDYDSNDEKNYIIKKLSLVSDYFRECPFEETLKTNIKEINKELNKKILLNVKKDDIEEKTKIHDYIKDKKRLFNFLSIWSNKEFFYNKNKYDIKYKLVNHLTEDFTHVLLKPISNIDYYLPLFTEYNYGNLFRKKENKKEILYLADLSFVVKEHKTPLLPIDKEEGEEKNNTDEPKKEEKKKQNENEKIEENKNNFNSLYDIKLNFYKDLENITNDKEKMKKDLSNELFIEYIKQKFLMNQNQHDAQVDSCLIKVGIHITGVFFNNSNGIGFYSYNKIHKEKEEDYDVDRKACFGSLFRPQNEKYDYYYINIPYNSIEFILRRKYFYKRTAIEIFTVNKKSFLFRIEDNKIKVILDNIKHYMKSTIEDIYIEYSKIDEKIGFYNKQTFLNLNKGFVPFETKKREMNIKDIYEKWSKWKISTLKMLMMTNLYASRSFQDLNQYPVLPWIITDYNSEEFPSLLNIGNNPENNLIRPFSTPMGMMDITPEAKKRKENYIQHWKSSEEDVEKEENYDRYGSHYSTSLYTTYYLVRLFPYSSMRIELQGKNFDDPNRLFNSLPISFSNAISQKADLRELIPEFFSLPEFFYNLNDLNLGEMGEKPDVIPVGDIALPPWAKGSGYIFISKHRELLESPEISEKLNDWINIIFGSKQKGKEARKLNNLYVKESYEEFEEEYWKKSLEDKIYLCKLVEFGVTPNQVYKNDAYKRNIYMELKNKRQLFPNMTEYLKRLNSKTENNEVDLAKELIIEETNFHIFDIPYKLAYFKGNKDKYRIFAVSQDKIKVFKRIYEKIQQKKTVPVLGLNTNNTPINKDNSNNTTENKDQNENKDEGKEIIKINLEKKREFKLFSPRYRMENNQAPMIFYNEGKNIALAGFYNGNILVQNLDNNPDDKKIKTKNIKIYQTNQFSPITQIVKNNTDNLVICANTLGIIYVFIINQSNKSEWTLYRTIYDHQCEISSIAINDNLNMFISCSKDGYCMSYILPECRLINSLRLTDNSFSNENEDKNNDNIYYPNIAIISNSPLACIIFYIESRQSLSIFSINGHFIKEEKIDFKIVSNGIKKYTDMQFKDYLLIFNPNKNCIDVYNIIDLQPVLSLPSIVHGFVDFILSNQLDHMLILVKYKGKNEEKNNEAINAKTTYKILVLRNPNCEIDWK